MKRLGIFMAAVLLATAGTAWGQLFGNAFDANKACIDLRIRYRLCGACPFCWPCADIQYWIPKWEVEASRDNDKEGDGQLRFFHVQVKPMTSGLFQQPCNENQSCAGGCLRPMLGALVDHFYDSRSDDDWLLNTGRMTRSRSMPSWIDRLRVAPPTGAWGRAYPRAGYVIHTSSLSASGLAALRGFNIARYPFDLWPDRGRYRLNACRLPDCGPLVPNAQFPEVGPFPCMQLETPARLGCAAAGFDFANALRSVGAAYDRGKDGVYTWIFWKHRRCTCPVPLGYCAEQLRGLGDDNRCVAPGSLASVVREVGEGVIGELESVVQAPVENLRAALAAQLPETVQSFTNVTQSAQGPPPPPVATPVTCSRSHYRGCVNRCNACRSSCRRPCGPLETPQACGAAIAACRANCPCSCSQYISTCCRQGDSRPGCP